MRIDVTMTQCMVTVKRWGQAIPATAILSAVDLIGISDLDARSCPHQKATAPYGTFSVWLWWRVLEYT